MSMHPTRNLFKEYKNKYFVETGTHRGDAIQLAIEAKFEFIRSIDIDSSARDFCVHRFDLENNRWWNIDLMTGDSAHALWLMIEDITEPITFWLDAHWQMFENTEPGSNPFPLLDEIQQISEHPVKNHTIMIDDMLIMQWNIVGYDIGLIKTRIEYINPKYEFKMFANPVVNGIMVAYVP